VEARSRNNALIFLCLLSFIALRIATPDDDLKSTNWDWRTVTEGPTQALGLIDSADISPVRVLGDKDDHEARTVAELLWSAGLLGVRIGPVTELESSSSEVWVLPATGDCTLARPVLDHVARGGGLVTWSSCEDLLLGLGAPPHTNYSESPGQTAFVASRDGQGPIPLPLPSSGAEFSSGGMGSWSAQVSRSGGASVVLRSEAIMLSALDLSAWLRELRQGDPELSGVDRDGVHGPKPNDLRPFPWAEPVWRQPFSELWIEVLVAEVSRLSRVRVGALPRLWTLPTPASSALILTSDQDFAEPDWMDSMLARTEERGGEMTLLSTVGTRQTNRAAAAAGGGLFLEERALKRAKDWGHGIGMHPNVVGLTDAQERAQALRLSHQRTGEVAGEDARVVRNHYLAWWDSQDPMELYVELQLWMELNYVSIGPSFDGAGFLFGAARPARFVGSQATLPVLSQATHLEDDVLVGDFEYSQGLSSAGAVRASERMLEVARRNRVPLVANLHPLWVVKDSGVFLDGLLEVAVNHGVPILSAERWATQSWDRLRRVMRIELRPSETGWSPLRVAEGVGSVPQWLWSPDPSKCSSPARPSPLSEAGCLERWTEN